MVKAHKIEFIDLLELMLTIFPGHILPFLNSALGKRKNATIGAHSNERCNLKIKMKEDE
jgi:hypothetical protein